MILINDHKENFLRVDHKNGNSGPPQLERRNRNKHMQRDTITVLLSPDWNNINDMHVFSFSYQLPRNLIVKACAESLPMHWNYTSSFMRFQRFQ